MNLKLLARDVFIGLSAALCVLLVRWSLDPLLGNKYPYIASFLVVAVIVWYYGWRAAATVVIIVFPAGNFFFIEPRGEIGQASLSDTLGFTVNMLSAAILIFLGHVARQTSASLERINAEFLKTNNDLAKANAELTQSAQRREQFLATLSHELRNPLAPIMMSAHLLEHSKFADAKSANAVQVLIRQTRHMKALLDDLLDKRRIALGKLEIKRALRDVRECINDAVESQLALVDQKKQKLKVIVPDKPVNAWVDGRRVTQIVANIVGNAAKHTNEKTEIEVSLVECDSEIIIAVQDNGVGIPPDVLTHIFEPFYSGTTHGSGGGLGIGLALTKGLVEMHGGKISVISSGKGSKFTIVLPHVVRSIKADAKKAQHLAADGQAASACS